MIKFQILRSPERDGLHPGFRLVQPGLVPVRAHAARADFRVALHGERAGPRRRQQAGPADALRRDARPGHAAAGHWVRGGRAAQGDREFGQEALEVRVRRVLGQVQLENCYGI